METQQQFEHIEQLFEQFLQAIPSPETLKEKQEYAEIKVKAYAFLKEVEYYAEKPRK